MDKRFILWVMFTWLVNCSFAQVNLTFDDSAQIKNWIVDTSSFIIASGKLNLFAPENTSTSQIFYPSEFIDSTTWQFDFEMDFNPSRNNYFRFIIATDLISNGSQSGYYIQVGGNDDDISLYQFDGQNQRLLVNGTDKILSHSKNRGSVRLIYQEGKATLMSKTNELVQWQEEGHSDEFESLPVKYIGFECNYTSTRRDKTRFDNLMVDGLPFIDRTPPFIERISYIDLNRLSLKFDEEIRPVDDFDILINNQQTKIDFFNPDSIVINHPFENAELYTLKIRDVSDLNGNVVVVDTTTYFYKEEIPQSGDLIISEILADPIPQIGLSEFEFVEVLNPSSKVINLGKVVLSDSKTPSQLDSILIYPNQYKVLCQKGCGEFIAEALELSRWPSINNDADSISLVYGGSILLDHFKYKDSLHGNDEKMDGGWSLELIDTNLDCNTSFNWTSSINSNGGTPGFINSVAVQDTEIDISNMLIELPNSVHLTFNHEVHCDLLEIVTDNSLTTNFTCNLNEVIIEFVQVQSGDYEVELNNLRGCDSRLFQETISLNVDLDAPRIIEQSQAFFGSIEITTSEAFKNPLFIIESDTLSYKTYPSVPDSITVFINQIPGLRYAKMHYMLEDSLGNSQSYYQEIDFSVLDDIEYGEIVITEFLPKENNYINSEFIEILNYSDRPVQLHGIKILDSTGKVNLPEYIIKPGHYLIFCPIQNIAEFSGEIHLMGLEKWLTINNDVEYLSLQNISGETVYDIEFKRSNYHTVEDNLSLEIIDPSVFCQQVSNWSFSESPDKSTPGKRNSVFESKPDLNKPQIISTYVEETQLISSFDEIIKSPTAENILIEPNVGINNLVHEGSLVSIDLNSSLEENQPYQIVYKNIEDCNSNIANLSSSIIIPDKPVWGDLIINEVMFEPDEFGSEYIEVYNNSQKFFSTHDLKFQYNDRVFSITQDLILKPESFTVLAKDKEALIHTYPNIDQRLVIQTDLPSLNNESGNLAVYTLDLLIDTVTYNSEWHYTFLNSIKGVSLERLQPESNGVVEESWFSASSLSNFGTPTIINSQFISERTGQNSIEVTPKVISPNNDGFQDFAIIHFKMNEPNISANLRIYDIKGNLIKEIANNELLPINGFLTWDGTDNSGFHLSAGYYILTAELYNDQGFSQFEKHKIGLFQNNF